MKDNLFDTKITWLDVVKILMLIVTAFSTWSIVDIMTPNVPLAFIREIASVAVVEGAFIGFEFATRDARNKNQMRFATIGFFASLAVIGLFAAASGILEFGGETLLSQSAGAIFGMALTVGDAVKLASLTVLVVWFVCLASIYRLYSLEDPDKIAEITKLELNGNVASEANTALRKALEHVKPIVAIARAQAAVKADYANELDPAQLAALSREIGAELRAHYGQPAEPTQPTQPQTPAGVLTNEGIVYNAEAPTPGTSFRDDGGNLRA